MPYEVWSERDKATIAKMRRVERSGVSPTVALDVAWVLGLVERVANAEMRSASSTFLGLGAEEIAVVAGVLRAMADKGDRRQRSAARRALVALEIAQEKDALP